MGVKANPPIGKGGLLIAFLIGGFFLLNKLGVINQNPAKQDNQPFNVKAQGEKYVNSLLTDEPLVYTYHAKERMDCRQISKKEVQDILRNGKVNWRKSKEADKPCPTYALEGKTKDGQTVRIVFADCNNATKVVTAIDLKNKYSCE